MSFKFSDSRQDVPMAFEIKQSTKGKPSLRYNGYSFRRDFESSQAISWRCSVNVCRKRVKTDKVCKEILSESETDHSHTMLNDTYAAIHDLRTRCRKRAAEDSDMRPTKVVKQETAREQPIFTTKAHVFQIDAGTKKDWVPASKSAVSVSYYFDNTRNTYRIISVDGSKAIVNSTITPNMTFTKTSQKFGQWSDPRANTVYGLGFASEQELTKFIEKFKEVKELTRQAAQMKAGEMNGGVDSHPTSPQPSANRQPLHQRTNSLSSIQNDSGNFRERRNSFTQGGSNGLPPNPSTEAQLKYENDRLKLALAQSSANAKKWEVELQTLKNNNARLTAALQESTANVEEWKKQLAAYKEESVRLKKRVLDQDKGGGESTMVAQMSEQIDRLKLDNHKKLEEIKQLNAQVNELSAQDAQTTALQARLQTFEDENRTLNMKVQDLQRQIQELNFSRNQEHQQLLKLQDSVGSKLTELYETHENILATIKQESNS